ncbi:unnamed protein product [Phaedon cochleariae]|uniref:ATP-dependent rRNA helicase SPB4-like C-terminal extension domain-containing protein n=1 Tax=Phaedon cochleariae TaxID=80249 RepID=A0A9N9SEJ1_PHACE|nr:unnamed protein product [Phaedon cochleariae]
MSAKEAFKAYVRAYDSHHLKTIFDVATLDLAKVGASFGFRVPPAVDLKAAPLLWRSALVPMVGVVLKATKRPAHGGAGPARR